MVSLSFHSRAQVSMLAGTSEWSVLRLIKYMNRATCEAELPPLKGGNTSTYTSHTHLNHFAIQVPIYKTKFRHQGCRSCPRTFHVPGNTAVNFKYFQRSANPADLQQMNRPSLERPQSLSSQYTQVCDYTWVWTRVMVWPLHGYTTTTITFEYQNPA